MNTHNEHVSNKLNGVECALGDGHPLHFILHVEKHGTLGAARWPGAEMDWKREWAKRGQSTILDRAEYTRLSHIL